MILVTGSTGLLGSAILSAAVSAGYQAEGSSRTGHASPRTIDFDKPSTVTFTGVDTLVLVSAGEAEDDVVIARHETAIAAAERDGVSHIVYTSLTSAGDHLTFALAHRWTEDRLRRSSINWTILRNGLYAELFGSLHTWSGQRLRSAFGDGTLSAVGRTDLAEAAAAVATSPGSHVQRIYELVGPPISSADLASALAVELDIIPLERRRTELVASALKPFQPAMLMSIYTSARHGFLGGASGDLVSLLGREPRDAIAIAAAAAMDSARVGTHEPAEHA